MVVTTAPAATTSPAVGGIDAEAATDKLVAIIQLRSLYIRKRLGVNDKVNAVYFHNRVVVVALVKHHTEVSASAATSPLYSYTDVVGSSKRTVLLKNLL
jgi:hypothetical protein